MLRNVGGQAVWAAVGHQSATIILIILLCTSVALASDYERATMADAIYRDCNGEGSQFSYGDELAYRIVGDTESNGYCRCVADYLTGLLSDSEIQHLRALHTETDEIADKEERASAMCEAFIQQ